MAKRPKDAITLSLGDLEVIASADKAMLLIINGLLCFLDDDGVMSRDDFLEFMQDVAESLEADDLMPSVVTFLRVHLTLLEAGDGPEEEHAPTNDR